MSLVPSVGSSYCGMPKFLLHQKRTYSKLQKFFVSSQWFPSLFIPLFVTFRKLFSNFFMVKILKVFDFCFAQSGNRDFLSVTSSFIYFTSMFQKVISQSTSFHNSYKTSCIYQPTVICSSIFLFQRSRIVECSVTNIQTKIWFKSVLEYLQPMFLIRKLLRI